MKEDRYEIRLAGAGGQGIITAAVLIAEAAGIHGGRYVAQTQSYGPEARGGKCKAEVVISRTPVDYPKVVQLDMFLAMTQEACDAYFFDFKPDGMLLVDSTFVNQIPTSRVVALPFTKIAIESVGRELAANMVALGAIGRLCPIVSVADLEAAMTARLPAAARAGNRQAIHAGSKAAAAIKLSQLPRFILPQEEDEC